MGSNISFDINNNILIVRIIGDIDHHESEYLRTEWTHMLYHNTVKHVVLNLEDVHFMDSSGLGVVLGRYKEVSELGGEMVICSMSKQVKRLFDISGMFKIIMLTENEKKALHHLGVAS